LGQTTETPGPVTELKQPSRWGESYSPKELLEQALSEVDRLNDVVIIARYAKSSNVDDSYNILSSTMSMHELLGFIELGKLMSISARRMGVDDDDEVS
jgi:hypothetical protein